jgi:hypothetical protein
MLPNVSHTPPSRACLAKTNELGENGRAKPKALERDLVHVRNHALTPRIRGCQVPIGWLALGNEGAVFAQGAAHRLRRHRLIGVKGSSHRAIHDICHG